MKFVNPIQVLRLAEQQHVGIAARPHQRERAQQVPVGEILAGSHEFALVVGPLVVVADDARPGRP